MKKFKTTLIMIMLLIGMVCISSQDAKASESEEPIDGSYLIEDDSSEGEAVNITKGIYLKSGTSSIAEKGTGQIAAGGRTVGQMVVSTISVTVRVERLVNGSWASYTSWTTTKSNAALVGSSKTLSVPIGYYYRVYCTHKANSDISGSYTNGIHI